jgi:hypothetical protein
LTHQGIGHVDVLKPWGMRHPILTI